MSDESLDEFKKELRVLKSKNTKLKNKIANAKGTDAAQVQKVSQESIDKNNVRIAELEDQIGALDSDEVSIDDVLDMVKNANTISELDAIEGNLEGEEVPQEITDALVAKKDLVNSILRSNQAKSYKDLEWVVLSQEELVLSQEQGLLVSYDPATKKGQIKGKIQKGK